MTTPPHAGAAPSESPLSPPSPAAGRRYGGLTAEERRSARRDQLIAAGLELFGTVGFAGTSIRSVLRQSGLAERYFYESFESLEDLLIGVHEHVHEVIVAAVASATAEAGDDVELRARAGIRAFVETVMTDPRWVRLKLQELGGSAGEGIRQFRRRAHTRYAALLITYGPNQQTRALGLQPLPLALAMVAAVESLLDAWAAGELEMTLDELIDHAAILIVGASNEVAARQRAAAS